jgi:hypothetical protein
MPVIPATQEANVVIQGWPKQTAHDSISKILKACQVLVAIILDTWEASDIRV